MRGRLSLVMLLLIPVSMQAQVLDDPMRPPEYAPVGAKARVEKGWHLSVIRIDANRRFAIINGRTLEVGEWVNKAQLVEILPERVRLKGMQGLFSIKLVKVKVRKTPVRQTAR